MPRHVVFRRALVRVSAQSFSRCSEGIPVPARVVRSPRLLVLLLLIALLGTLPLPAGLGVRNAAAQTAGCPCTIWPSSATPANPSVGDSDAVEVGVRFRASVSGLITGVRFYKGSANTGTHVGKLWSNGGDLLASATFGGESASGWQQVSFGTPVPITGGTTYVASYYAPTGRYALDGGYFADSGHTDGPLTALRSGVDGLNGVYRYGVDGGFPTSSWNASNYWVDVVFDADPSDTTPPTVTDRTPAPGATGVPVTAVVTGTFSEPVVGSSAQVALTGPGGADVPGSAGYDEPSRTVTFSPAASLAESTTYTATVSGAQDGAGNTMAPVTWTFTTAASPPPGSCPCTIWPSSATPTTASVSDTDAVELGVKFRASVDGFVTGVRFYKGSANTGTHLGRLWRADGTLLASATFGNETASGWQQVSFSAPVAVTADTTYVASYYAPTGRYALDSGFFTAATTNGPLTALESGADGPNGVYRYGSPGGFPTNSWNASNYWVDVVFAESPPPDTTAPAVTGRSPAPNATGIATTAPVTATFSEPVQQNTIEVSLTGPGGSADGAKTYDPDTRTVTFTPSAPLAVSTAYTATVSGAQDSAGNAMTPVSWPFTTTSTPPPGACPCTIWPNSAEPATASAPDDAAIEVGVKFRASQDGFITGIRFYKGSANTGVHVGSLWSATGAPLATVTFSGESASGWQQAAFSAPVPIVADTTYVASYHAPAGRYAVNSNGFAAGPVVQGPLTALQSGADGGNGVYRYGGHAFPAETFQASNYWVDVVFDQSGTDPVAPTVVQRAPAPGATGVAATTAVSATFSEPVQQPTIAFELRDPGNALVPATLTYDTGTWTARLSPQSPLAYATTYTASLSGAKDAAGNTMAPLSWTFTTEAPPQPGIEDGPGGPIAVLSSGSDKFSRYTAEILRAEGLNEFATLEVGAVTAGTLASYDVAVLGPMTLTSAQVSMLTDWVAAGGNLIAFRPDPQLASLLGLTPAGGTASDKYLRVDTAQAPGAGITAATMQFHGAADLYNLGAATAVASLYTDAATATAYPAVTLRSVGGNGGHAAAFTYDLARSIVYTRQGNPAWAGMERDAALGPDEAQAIRTNDLFYPDWIDLTKIEIPQADEQQRLLANLVQVMNRDRTPLPRFWYFPNGKKAVVVSTGDDHGYGGTAGRFDKYAANSASGCSVADWECLRLTSYVDPSSPMSDSAAVGYQNSGFEVALHPNNGCYNYTTQAVLAGIYQDELAAWRTTYPGVASPATNRFHCMVWSDWSSQPKVELANGMRLDTNYYHWSGAWLGDNPGFMTGSGMPMRLADADGTMLDVYQAATQMTDESGQTYPFTSNALLDRATGAEGYYGAFVANMHTDAAASVPDDQMLASAQAHEVPVITAKQLLTWLDARNAASFGDIGWNGSTLSFTIDKPAAATGLRAMVPTAGAAGTTLSGLTRAGAPVAYTLETIKGLEYATFPATGGSYAATYSSPGGGAALSIAAASVSTAPDGTASLAWRTSEPATSEAVFGTAAESVGDTSIEAGASREHTITLDALRPDTTYYYRLRSRDLSGRHATWPPVSQEPLAFRTPARDRKPPAVSAVKVLPLPDGTATVTWATSEPATSAVSFGTAAGGLGQRRFDDRLARRHTIVLTGLKPGQTYWYQVESTDGAGNKATAPSLPQRFLSAGAGVADHTTATFRMGSRAGVVADAPSATSTGQLALAAGRSRGRYVSRVLAAGTMVTWDRAVWQASTPNGAAVRVYVRTGSTAAPGRGWTSWQRMSGSGDSIATAGRYLQYRVELAAGPGGRRPQLAAIGFTHTGAPPVAAGESGG
jgi:methionine-rich copper-binding protein CopC